MTHTTAALAGGKNRPPPSAPPPWLLASAASGDLIIERLLSIASMPLGTVNRRVVLDTLDDLIQGGAFPTRGGVEGAVRWFLDQPDEEQPLRLALGALVLQTHTATETRSAFPASMIGDSRVV